MRLSLPRPVPIQRTTTPPSCRLLASGFRQRSPSSGDDVYFDRPRGDGRDLKPPREQPTLNLAALIVVMASLLVACEGPVQADANPPARVELGPKLEVRPPEGYAGPIDPEWPPRATTELEVALRASRLLREGLAQAPPPLLPTQPVLLPPASAGLHVEAGKIGPFRYLEVIVGKVVHPDDALPLVVLLHGRGNKPQIPAGPLEAGVPFRMFLPQAPDPLGEGFTWLAVPTNSEDSQLFARSLSGRLDELAPAILAFREMRPTLGKPLVVGFSQGGILTFGLMTRFPGEFGAGFPMAGWLPPALYPSTRLGQTFPYIFAQHGSADVVVPTEKGLATVQALRSRGIRVDYREVRGAGHVVTPDMSDEVRRAVRRILQSFEGSVRKGR